MYAAKTYRREIALAESQFMSSASFGFACRARLLALLRRPLLDPRPPTRYYVLSIQFDVCQRSILQWLSIALDFAAIPDGISPEPHPRSDAGLRPRKVDVVLRRQTRTLGLKLCVQALCRTRTPPTILSAPPRPEDGRQLGRWTIVLTAVRSITKPRRVGSTSWDSTERAPVRSIIFSTSSRL